MFQLFYDNGPGANGFHGMYKLDQQTARVVSGRAYHKCRQNRTRFPLWMLSWRVVSIGPGT